MLTGVALIFVQLMIVTAIALFFSTFSSPLLSAALTAGLYVAGHFNADLKNFDMAVDSPVATTIASASRSTRSRTCTRCSAASRSTRCRRR